MQNLQQLKNEEIDNMTHLTHSTKSIKAEDIVRAWHVVDAKGKVLGRLASDIASMLIGKNKVTYVDYLDCGDEVVVINAADVVVTGKKATTKTYDSFSGYPGGLRKISYGQMMENKPGEIVRHAVSGMLPKNKLRDKRLARLHVFAGSEHTFTDKVSK